MTNFGFSRYAERLGRSANSFDELYRHLQKENTYIDRISLDIPRQKTQSCTAKISVHLRPLPRQSI